MRYKTNKLVSAGLLLAVCACAATTESTLPALDTRETSSAEALVVQSDSPQGFRAPSGIVRGAGSGAAKSAGAYLRNAPTTGGPDSLLYFLLAPVFLPALAAGGAIAAHSSEEVDAAVAAFNAVGRDQALLASLDRRLLDSMGQDTLDRWSCVAGASSNKAAPCPESASAARLTLQPRFGFNAVGEYDPEIEFLAQVAVTIDMDRTVPEKRSATLLEAVWGYHESLGPFFELAKDEGALLRRKLNRIFDLLASRIAEDLYNAPQPQLVTSKGGWKRVDDLPEGTVVRMAQGAKLPGNTTHAILRPISIGRRDPGIPRNCWIDAVNGQEMAQNRRTPFDKRLVSAMAGPARIDMSCIHYQYSASRTAGQEIVGEVLEHYVLNMALRPGWNYSLFP